MKKQQILLKSMVSVLKSITLIATWMNEDPLLRDLVHALVKETDIR
ncbi:MAG: hypothetical protein MRJ65_02330 [Candidatus Brocadiaceae bacterium]|nr:hypothetical protein [Candidatus Brocadiaceae bacterium]